MHGDSAAVWISSVPELSEHSEHCVGKTVCPVHFYRDEKPEILLIKLLAGDKNL